MHGNPLFRVLALTALLAVLGLIVSAVARSPRPVARPGSADPLAPSTTEADSVSTVLSIQLSAPVTSLSLRALDGETLHIAPHRPVDLAPEFRVRLPIRASRLTVLLTVEWVSPSPNRFVRIVLEPEGLPNREVILHAPADLQDHAVTFQWPDDTPHPSEPAE